MKKLISLFAAAALVLTVGCEKNPGTDVTPEENASITFDGGSEPAPVLDGEGNREWFSFTASASWSIEKDAVATWLTVSPVSGGAGKATVIVSATENDTFEERNASLAIRCGSVEKRIVVTQKQANALIVSSNKVEFDETGGTFELTAQSNVDNIECTVESSASEWLKMVSTRALTTKTMTFSVAANTSSSKREGRIMLKAGDRTEQVTVYQQGYEVHFVLSQNEYVVSAEGETIKIELQSNVEYTMTLPAVDWIVENTTRAVSSYTHYITVKPNENAASRSAEIVFANAAENIDEHVTILQRGTASADFKWPNNEAADGITRAFPGAEGGGMYVTGGRGGKVIHVTNLNDSGAGSFRDAVGQSGARTIVFDVAGTITLNSDLKITKGDLTIAGQTAPGDGICIKGGTVNIQASNIIIRYMRFRLGDESSFLSDGSDCIWGRYNENIILDHCSMSWSVDEVASFYANRNFTMQWCMVAESMCNSVHGKGGHGYGGIWGGKNASFHHNMLAHNKSRNARIDHPEIYLQNGGATDYRPTHRGNVDYRNNVIYNWGDNSTYGGEDGHFNVVGNYYKPGPASKDRKYFVDANGFYSSSSTQYNYPRLYLEGNVHTKYPEFTGDQTKGIYLHDGTGKGDDANMFLTAPLAIKADDSQTCWTTTHSADAAYELVLEYVGASLRRDAVDSHIVADAKSGGATYSTGSNGSTGGIIDSQKDVGGWPTLTATDTEKALVKDSDGDGIPDYYEDLLGLDANDASDGNAKTLDSRYTNLEMYLHYLVQDIVAAQVAGGTNTELK